MINNLYYGSDDVNIDCFRNASFKFDTDVLATFLRRIYNGFDTSKDVEPTMWREILRIINEATVDGLVKGNYDTNIDKTFLQKLAHSNEVFSAFKVHNMGVDMAKKMRTDDGKLKPFSEWKKDIKGIASHYCGAWLQTEYNTATLRAKFAAEWKQYEADADIMPNLRWMPTTSANPEEEHKEYWMKRLTLPVGDKFWDKHHPGDHWNCKCSLEQTDEPANPDVLSRVPDVKAQKGLAANPGKTGEMFDRSHPYYEQKCSKCWVKKNKSFMDVITLSENCNKCPYMDGCIEKQKQDYHEDAEFGKRLLISNQADPKDMKDNIRVSKSLLRSFEDMEIKIRPHVISHQVSNPELLINQKKSDNKRVESYKGIANGFSSAIGQGSSAVVIDFDSENYKYHMLPTHKVAAKIQNRWIDFKEGKITECYVVYHDHAIVVTAKDIDMSERDRKVKDGLIRMLDSLE